MMRQMAIAALAALMAAGCATVTITEENGIHGVAVKNTGWYLLSLIPLGSGNPEKPNRVSFKCFRDTATIENNMKLLEYAIKESGADGVKNLTSFVSDEKIFIILLKCFTIHTSAELVHDDKADADRGNGHNANN